MSKLRKQKAVRNETQLLNFSYSFAVEKAPLNLKLEIGLKNDEGLK
jgi:hypothetical protein